MKNWLPKRVPPGYEVDHLVALFKGGADKVYNMALKLKIDHVNRHRYYRP